MDNHEVSNNISELVKNKSFIKFLTHQVKGVFSNHFDCEHFQSDSLTSLKLQCCYECTRDFTRHSTQGNYFINLYNWFKQNETENETETKNQFGDNNQYSFYPIDTIKCFKTIFNYITPEQGSYFCSPWLDGMFLTGNIDNISNVSDIFEFLCIQGHLETLQWLYKCEERYNHNQKYNITINFYQQHTIFVKVYKKHPDILSWLFSLKILNEIDSTYIDKAFQNSCRLGNIQVIKLLLNLTKDLTKDFRVDRDITNGYALSWACQNGNIEIVKLLLNLDKERKINNPFAIKEAFMSACEYGHIEIVKLLLELEGEQRVIYDSRDVLLLVCKKRYLEIIKLLLNLDGDRKINLYVIEQAFVSVCCLFDTDLVDFFLNLKGDRYINIHHDDELALRMACEHGCTEIVKLLLNLKKDRYINVYVLNDMVFQLACCRDRLEIVEFLLEFDKERKISFKTIDNIFIRYDKGKYYSPRILKLLKLHNGNFR